MYLKQHTLEDPNDPSDKPDSASMAEKMVNEAFSQLKIDNKNLNYIPIKKDQFLMEIKRFLYNYCTTGRLYPNY
jgi:hypothetical protein